MVDEAHVHRATFFKSAYAGDVTALCFVCGADFEPRASSGGCSRSGVNEESVNTGENSSRLQNRTTPADSNCRDLQSPVLLLAGERLTTYLVLIVPRMVDCTQDFMSP